MYVRTHRKGRSLMDTASSIKELTGGYRIHDFKSAVGAIKETRKLLNTDDALVPHIMELLKKITDTEEELKKM